MGKVVPLQDRWRWVGGYISSAVPLKFLDMGLNISISIIIRKGCFQMLQSKESKLAFQWPSAPMRKLAGNHTSLVYTSTACVPMPTCHSRCKLCSACHHEWCSRRLSMHCLDGLHHWGARI